MYNQLQRKGRLYVVFFFYLLFLAVLLIRLFHIQIFRSSYFKQIAHNQYKSVIEIRPRRGIIYDRAGRPLAVSLTSASIYADPQEISNNQSVADELASLLGRDRELLLGRLNRDASFVWLERRVSPEIAETIKKLDIPGVNLVREPKRFYPHASLASHVLGFTNIDDQGLEGLELFYDHYLKGRAGWRFAQRDAKKRTLLTLAPPALEEHEGNGTLMGTGSAVPPVHGFALVLTIDEVIQHIAERELDKVVQKRNAKGGVIIVMDPRSGKILALASSPAFDLNHPVKFAPDARRNRAVCDLFEPGSVFKFVTASAALEQGVVGLEDRIYCENGAYRIYGHTLHDHKPHGWLTFRQVIEYSSNIGTVKVAQKLGEENLHRYIKLFGFGAQTGIDIPGEISGIVRAPDKWSKLSITAIPMGQEIGVTPIQIISAISAIANNGVLLKPRLVRHIQDEQGEIIKSFGPVVVRRVISRETAETLKEILTGVVDNGTGRQAQIPGYKVAGKTGTAQKIDASGSYSHTRFIASFAGFAPAEQPVISILVMLDEPRPVYYGGQVAAPVFQKVASETLRYLEVKPQ